MIDGATTNVKFSIGETIAITRPVAKQPIPIIFFCLLSKFFLKQREILKYSKLMYISQWLLYLNYLWQNLPNFQ